jgi:hypothetical protein
VAIAVVAVFVVAALIFTLISIPDMRRYARIRSM